MPETCSQLMIPATGRATMIMAKDSEGRKFNRIPKYDRVQNGKTVHVSAHVRSNRSDSKGQKKKMIAVSSMIVRPCQLTFDTASPS